MTVLPLALRLPHQPARPPGGRSAEVVCAAGPVVGVCVPVGVAVPETDEREFEGGGQPCGLSDEGAKGEGRTLLIVVVVVGGGVRVGPVVLVDVVVEDGRHLLERAAGRLLWVRSGRTVSASDVDAAMREQARTGNRNQTTVKEHRQKNACMT